MVNFPEILMSSLTYTYKLISQLIVLLMNAKMGVTITERVNITKYVFINLHYLRLKKNDGGHI